MKTTAMGTGKRVFLHVGAPLLGADGAQEALWHASGRLARGGVGYPLHAPGDMFAATMDLRDMDWGGRRDPAWTGMWEKVASRARDWTGDRVLLSHELLAGATAEQAARAVASLGDADVHVVFTARDLARQLAADWSEHLRHQHTVTFDRFVDDLVELGIGAPEPFGPMFWGLHDPVHALRAWASAVPAANVHVVTAPHGGDGVPELWRRFMALTGVDPEWCDLAALPEQRPLGRVEAELVRLVNGRLRGALGGAYERLVRQHVAGEILRGRPDAREIVVPERHHAWLADRSRRLVDDLAGAGYAVVGDLADLLPDLPSEAGAGGAGTPEAAPSADELTDAALVVIEAVLRDLARVEERRQIGDLSVELAKVRDQLAELTALAPDRPSPLRRAAQRMARDREQRDQ
ncbi:hypothetical protein [Actinomadura harenae]|uniref:Uncharacterized protein n=1 Tax=Actinomadura harenae TaxID=2483351 RepID=A0A3M2LG26_9ACTN|nr:hypothetical protein [Actinomadura harenae]RMI36447.1 hypothetical protein EBO15_38595 [Actinomadura harenae]